MSKLYCESSDDVLDDKLEEEDLGATRSSHKENGRKGRSFQSVKEKRKSEDDQSQARSRKCKLFKLSLVAVKISDVTNLR